MAIFNSTVTVTTAQALTTTASTSPVATFTIIIQNIGSGDLFVGGPGVTTTNGIKVASGSSISLDNLISGETVYAVSSASSTVQTLTIVR